MNNPKNAIQYLFFFLAALGGVSASTLYSQDSAGFTPGALKTTEPAENVSLPSLFSDNMILQRNRYVPIWGTAEPGGVVEIAIAGRRKSTVVGPDGNWRVHMNPLPAGGPHTLTVKGQEIQTFENVLSGEVWLASGQSNMEMPLAGWGQINNYEEEIAKSDFPEIRLFQAAHETSVLPRKELVAENGTWQICSPETIPEFSSTAYFFARHIHEHLGIPVGIIHSSWGGTVAEAWTSRNTLDAHFPEFRKQIASMIASAEKPENEEQFLNPAILQDSAALVSRDTGYLNGVAHWASEEFDDSGWDRMELPGRWEEAAHEALDGVVWYRKSLDLPENWHHDDLVLHLGPIDDSDITWFNGRRIGSTNGYNQPRSYGVPKSVVNDGNNTITVRVIDTGGGGGFWGRPGQLRLKNSAGDSLNISGPWKYRVAVPVISQRPNRPTVLYNAMIHPIIPFAIRGAIWYQGESNTGRAYQYRDLFPRMIRDWRINWGQGQFPFLFVQLANFMERNEQPVESEWAELREAQLMALSEPNTGMAVTIDIGNANDIHPKNKQEVGRRLALNARATVYGQNIAYSGPIYRNMQKLDGNRIRISFDHVNGGLQARGGELKGFAVAGNDRTFHWAEAEITGDDVVVYSPDEPDPVAVRYGWSANPDCNLYNGAGLPASPFRTDNWPGVTEGNN
ncbi:MAG: sialate O-acetylesterase [Balneolaceae bacterium]|nr:sialate O-acetylesterase [Balneolaceae bacterium]